MKPYGPYLGQPWLMYYLFDSGLDRAKHLIDAVNENLKAKDSMSSVLSIWVCISE